MPPIGPVLASDHKVFVSGKAWVCQSLLKKGMTVEMIQVRVRAGELQNSGGHGVFKAVLGRFQELLVD